MNIKMNNDHLSGTENLTDNVNIATRRYARHPIILDICRLVTIKGNFSFNQVTYEKLKSF